MPPNNSAGALRLETSPAPALAARERLKGLRATRWLLCCLAALGCFLAAPAHGQYDPDWSRHFRIGAMVGLNIKAEFRSAGQVTIPGSGNPGLPNVGGANHFFDDGYVRVDQTGNAQGMTSFWGYERASQHDRAANTLLMHNTASVSAAGGTAEEDGGPLPGFDLAYGGNLWYWKRLRIGYDLGFGLLPMSITAKEMRPANASQSIYSFDTGGIVLPTAPYNGGPSGQGPTIHDIATLVANTNVAGLASVSETLDVILYTLRLGPSVYWDFNQYLGMSVSAGPAVGLVSGDLRSKTTFTTSAVTSKVGGTDVVFGGYVNATLMWHVRQNGDIYLGAQYMPLGNATISGAGQEGRLNLSGAVFVSAGFNWPF